MENLAGHSIKGYELQERIGAGGFGAVYRAYQSTIGREVAVKIILPGFASHPDFIRRFETEAQIIARLEHPYITPLFDYWRDPDGAYLVMRWLRGGSLREALQKLPFDTDAAALLLDQITAALAVAHRNNVIHRDLKPGNILLDEDGNAYLADFGIAKDIGTPGSTEIDAIVGSPDYLSPEQARSESVTAQTDIYSLGVVLYEMLAGEHPFPKLSAVERMYKHLSDPLPIITNLPDDTCGNINDVIQKATAKNPAYRYPDALSLATAFREAIQSQRNHNVVETLTPREQEILQRVIAGQSNRQIAADLVVTVGTVKWYITQIYRKLNVRSRVQAIVRARELNLIVNGSTSAAIASITNGMAIPTEDFKPENPYKGLRAFQAADYHDFFGRELLIDKLLKRMGEAGAMTRFLAVVGPSGSGKSSLVKAGLIPALWRGGLPGSEKWFIAEMLPGTHPLDELEIALTRVAVNQATSLHEQLERDERGLLRAAQLILPEDGSEIVIIIDQFEEVFTLVQDENARIRFLKLLHAAVCEPRSRVRMVINLRADFYDRPLQYPDFGELIRSRMETVLPLSADGLERAIARPAEQAGLKFEDGLVASIVAEVNYQAGALPLLQYALTELFERREGRKLTQAAYQEIGGAGGALATRAEEIYLEFSEEGREAIRQMFLRLVTLGESASDTRRRVQRSELLGIAADADLMDEAIDTFASYRLLSLDNDPGTRSPTVEVAHEAILNEWERLNNWINLARDEIKMQQQLAHMTEEWLNAGKDASYLVGGLRLEQFERWAKNAQLALTVDERAYLDASITKRTQEAEIDAQRKQREVKLEKRSQSFLRGLVAVLLLAAVVAIALTGVAVTNANEAQTARAHAESQARISQSRELVQYAINNLDHDGELSTLLALQAVNTTYQADRAVLPEANTVLHQAIQALHTPLLRSKAALNLSDWFLPPAFSSTGNRILYPLQFSQDFRSKEFTAVADVASGQVLYTLEGEGLLERIFDNRAMTLVGSPDKGIELRIWDIGSRDHAQLLRTIPIHMSITTALDFKDASIDSTLHYFAIWSPTQGMQVWDLTTGQEVKFDKTWSELRNHVTFSPDGSHMAVMNADGTISVLDTSNWTTIYKLQSSNGGFSIKWAVMYFSGDSRYMAVANLNKAVSVWDLSTGKEQVFNTNFVPTILALNTDGTRLATSTDLGRMIIWDTVAKKEILNLNTGKLQWAVFNPDSTQLATIHSSKVQIWNLVPGQEFLTLVTSSSVTDRGALGLDYSPDGKRLGAGSLTNTPIVWDALTGEKLLTLSGHTGRVLSTAWSPLGTQVASAGLDTDVILWDAATGKQIQKLSGHTKSIYDLAFSPDGTKLASSSDDKSVRIWDVATGKLLLALAQPASSKGVAWSPDGKRIAAGTDPVDANGHVVIWNAIDGKQQLDIPAGYVRVSGVTFNADGTRILAGLLETKTAMVWDAQSGQKLLTISDHTDLVTDVSYSPDGSQIATSSFDGSVKIWDANTGQAMLTIYGSVQGVDRGIFSPDGKHFATQNEDGTTRVYALSIEDAIALARSRLTRSFTDDECQRYLHMATCPPH